MKHLSLILTVVVILFATFDARGQSPELSARMQQRDLRHQGELRTMDSIVLSRNFKFEPQSFQQQPAGNVHSIYTIMYFLEFYKEGFVDIDLPYIVGFAPPYHLSILNYITYDVQNYTAIQDVDGWSISFNTNLYSVNRYTFTLRIYSITREGVLNIVSDLYPTVTYYGSVESL